MNSGSKRSGFGIFCGIMTGVCWGVSGVFGQFLFENYGITENWLVPIRLTTAGIVLLIYLFIKERADLVRLTRNKKDLAWTAVAGILGTMMFQLTFFGSVHRSNAGTATVLQYLAPVFILVYLCLRDRKAPTAREIVAIVLAVAGIFLISTHGNIHEMVMTPEALAWGIACAFFMFLTTVLPEGLYKKYPTVVVTGWALLFGGVALNLIMRPWQYEAVWNLAVFISLFFIIIGGSVAAYLFYASSIVHIGPEKASLCACIEPVTATVLSALWLKTDFAIIDLVGFVLIIITVVILNTDHSGEGNNG